MNLVFECGLFLLGLAFGSFLNVCISRIPHGESVVAPRSHCPSCGASLRWFDNIPLLSWLLLRGRCRDCRSRIALRYPAVELLTAVLFLSCGIEFGQTWLALKFCVLCFLLAGLVFMDAETGLLPGEFTYPGIVAGVALSWFAGTDSAATELLLRAFQLPVPEPHLLSLLDAVIAAVAGAGFFYLAWALYYLVRKRHGMGFGDIALMAMVGSFLGLKLTLLVVFCAPVLAVLWSVVILVRAAPGESRREMLHRRELPFGVFLGSCSLLAAFVGEAVWRWYLNFF